MDESAKVWSLVKTSLGFLIRQWALRRNCPFASGSPFYGTERVTFSTKIRMQCKVGFSSHIAVCKWSWSAFSSRKQTNLWTAKRGIFHWRRWVPFNLIRERMRFCSSLRGSGCTQISRGAKYFRGLQSPFRRLHLTTYRPLPLPHGLLSH